MQAALEAAAAELGDIMEEHDPTCVLAALVQFMRGHKWDIPTQSVRFMSLLFAMHPEAGPTLDARIRVAFPKYYRKLFASDKAADDERIAYILKWVRDFCANEHEDEVTEVRACVRACVRVCVRACVRQF